MERVWHHIFQAHVQCGNFGVLRGDDISTANPEDLVWSATKMDISLVNVIKKMFSGKLCLTIHDGEARDH